MSFKTVAAVSIMSGCALLATFAHAECKLSQLGAMNISDANNRPIVDGEIDGKPVRVLLDTGASLSHLSSEAAARLGLKVDTGAAVRVYSIHGENRVGIAYLDSLKLGTFGGRKLRMAVLTRPQEAARSHSPDVVLGSDLLSQYVTEYDFGNRAVRVFRAEGCKVEQLAYWSKTFSIVDADVDLVDNPHIGATVTVNGRKMLALLDTGAQFSWITPVGAGEAGIKQGAATASDGDANGQVIMRKGETHIDGWQADVASFSIGDDETIQHVKLEVADIFGHMSRGETGSHLQQRLWDSNNVVLGYDFFQAHRIIVAPKERKMLITHNPGRPIFQVRVTAPLETPVEAPAEQPATPAPTPAN